MPILIRLLSACLLVALVGCAKHQSNPLRQPALFARVYAQILFATTQEEASADSTRQRAQVDSLLASQKLARVQLDDAVRFFSAEPERWKEVYEDVVAELDRLSTTDAQRSTRGRQQN